MDKKNKVGNNTTEVKNNLTECPICYEDFPSLTVLPCIHAFCLTCLQELEKRQGNGKITCPLCRKEHSSYSHQLPKLFVPGYQSSPIQPVSPVVNPIYSMSMFQQVNTC